MDIQEIAEKLADFSKQNFEFSWEGNSALANKAYAQSIRLKKKIVDNPQIVEELTKTMLSNANNIHMARQGMLIGLSLGVNTELAKAELKKEISYDNDIDKCKKKFAFEARMIKENIDNIGYILLFKGQNVYKVYNSGWMD